MTNESEQTGGRRRGRGAAFAILMYHDIVAPGDGAGGDPVYDVPIEAFSEQMAYLRDAGHPVLSLRDLLRRLAADEPPGAGGVVLTFDDGRRSNFDRALPVLRHHGFPAEFFLTVSKINSPGFMSWEQARQLRAAGVTVGSHLVHHVYLEDLAPDVAATEIRDSKRTLEDRLGTQVDFLAPPGGRIDANSVGLARQAGYRGICNSRIGLCRPGADPFDLARVPVDRATTLERFAAVVEQRARVFRALRARAGLLRLAKRVLGNRRYDRWRERMLTGNDADS